MKKYDKEIIQIQLEHEKEVIEELKKMYEEAEKQIDEKIQMLMADELTQSKIYQIEYQKALKGQIGAILDSMNSNNYDSIQDYLKKSYEDGYIGTMYSLKEQGIPLVVPINQEQVVKAIQLDSKLSGTLYEAMGVNTNELKKSIRNEVSRGISNAYSYQDIARNINNSMGIGLNKSIRIARTEGHRVNQQSTYDAMDKAKKKGANIVKQWDATLDAKTRPSHQRVDGEIRELDETFSNGLRFPGDPQGSAGEVINCRCVLLQRARWALDEDELKTLQERAAYFGLDKTDSFNDYKSKYLNAMINSNVSSRNTYVGKPGAVVHLGANLSKRQRTLLDQLIEYDSRVTVHKNKVNMKDLAALTAQTGDEFALFTKGNERLIVRGDTTSVNIDIDKARELAENGYRWSGHTHPGYDSNVLLASEGDIRILNEFQQKQGVIYNSLGEYLTFERD